MKRWITADTHFGHFNIIGYCGRPFTSSEEMDQTMIDNWNSIVAPNDIVWHLGDFSFGKGSLLNLPGIVSQLNGDIILYRGNHDRQTRTWYLRAGFKELIGGEYYEIEKNVLLSHKPYPTKFPNINIHGHVHELMHMKELGVYYCVCVEQTNYTPVDLDELIKKAREVK